MLGLLEIDCVDGRWYGWDFCILFLSFCYISFVLYDSNKTQKKTKKIAQF